MDVPEKTYFEQHAEELLGNAGLNKAKDILDRHPELMAYFIYSDDKGGNAVWYSPSLRDKIAE